MRNFLAHKSRIISSKRDSQRIDQLHLAPLPKSYEAQLHQIGPQHYRITNAQVQNNCSDNSNNHSSARTPEPHEPTQPHYYSCTRAPMPEQITDPMSQVLQLMGTLNQLQQKGREPELQAKLAEFKSLLGSIQTTTRRPDFYGDNDNAGSAHSFESRNSSEQEYQSQTERQGYELSESYTEQEAEVPFEVKYRRIDHNDTFSSSSSEEEQNSIVHLFSYEKEQLFETPLSSISERESEYYSPDSQNITLERLEYKKIQYLLQTSQKKHHLSSSKRELSTTSSREGRGEGRGSQEGRGSEEGRGIEEGRGSEEGRMRSQKQLVEMIGLLQNKYGRKVKGKQDTISALNAALNSQLIRPRAKK